MAQTPGSARLLPALLQLLRATSDSTARWRLVAALLVVAAAALLAALSPLALKSTIDALSDPALPSGAVVAAALPYAAAYLSLLALGRLLSELRPLVTGAAEQRLHTRLRQRLFGHLLDLPLSFHLDRRTGAVLQGMQQATTGCQLVVTHAVGSVVPATIEIVAVGLVLLHLEQPDLLTVFALTAMAYIVAYWRGALRLRERAHRVSDTHQDVHALLADSLLNCEAIKCAGAEPELRSRYERLTCELERRWAGMHLQKARTGLSVTVIFACSLTATMTLSAHAVAQGSLTVGGFVLANLYALQIVRPLELMGAAARDLAQAMELMRPLLTMLQQPPEQPAVTERPDADGARPARGSMVAPGARLAIHTAAPRVRFEGVRFAYGAGRPALIDLDLDVAPGSTLAIVGPSGSGKSTVARLLLRLHAPQSGRILLDKVPIVDLPLREHRFLIGLVPQDTLLLNDSIATNIALGMTGVDRKQIENAARVAQLEAWIDALPMGLDTPVGERGLRLSGGERQRIAIARAVLRRPRLFVFDEATSMLDARTEAAIVHDLRVISAGCTTILMAHRLSTIRHADEIVVLEEGRVTERGRHEDLLRAGGTYAELWQRQRCSDSA